MTRTASFVYKTPSIIINGVDLSEFVREVDVNLTKVDIDDTSSGDSAVHHIPGLQDNKATCTMRQSFAASKVDATLYPLWDGDTIFPLHIAPAGGTNSATNPAWVFDACLLEYGPISGKMGDLAEVKVVFGINSVVTRDVT